MMSSSLGIVAVIPAVVLLAISFFVLVVAKKTEGSALKAFGYVVAVLLWCASVVAFSVSLNALTGGSVGAPMSGCPMASMMRSGMKAPAGVSMPMMRQDQLHQMHSGELKQGKMQRPPLESPAQEDNPQ